MTIRSTLIYPQRWASLLASLGVLPFGGYMAVKCVHPGCRIVVREEGECRCDKHRTVRKKEIQVNRIARGGRRNSHIYDTQRWKRISIKKRTVTPFCEDCEDEGRMVIADVVDHIVELEDGGKPYNWSNLKSLCHYHHNLKSSRERKLRGGMGGGKP